jgi:hypothetical protein
MVHATQAARLVLSLAAIDIAPPRNTDRQAIALEFDQRVAVDVPTLQMLVAVAVGPTR